VLQPGAKITEIQIAGFDFSPAGYFEGAVWNTPFGTFAPNYISGFGGVWQSSGTAAAPGFATVTLFSTAHPPHTVQNGSQYTIGVALKDTSLVTALFLDNIKVTYTIP